MNMIKLDICCAIIIQQMRREEQLKLIWAEHGYPGVEKLWRILTSLNLTKYFKRGDVAELIAEEKVSQLHHRPVKAKGSHITTPGIGVMYVIDLLDMTAYGRYNSGYKWLLLCMDIFSRAAAIVAVKDKSASSVAEALEYAFEEFGRIPKIVMSDQGSEFKGATSKLLKKLNIIHKMVEVGDHRRLGVVDRFSGVVKGWIAKHMTHEQTKTYPFSAGSLFEFFLLTSVSLARVKLNEIGRP